MMASPKATAFEEMKDDPSGELFRRVSFGGKSPSNCGFCCNTILTSRYNWLNFWPKILFYEFSKLANAYFLVISICQTIKPISNTGGFPASLPALTIIVCIDMFFAALEDYKRHQADNFANALPCQKYENQRFVSAKWQQLQVGDLVKVANREGIPADLVILAVSESDPDNPKGICYVETKSLDGETNLKLRQGLECTYAKVKTEQQLDELVGEIVCEKPNNCIHRFSGTITLATGEKEVISPSSLLLRGSFVRNTEFIYGIVVNTGKETKIMMASEQTPAKWSNMEKRLNKQILYLVILMILLCLIGAIAQTVWNHKHLIQTTSWYLNDPDSLAQSRPVANFFVTFIYFFLLLNSFIPVSLYVSMTSVKFMQAYFMNNDIDMYYEPSDTPCQVRSMSLNEELGQVDFVFTDKTGTLTCNVMEFRKCSINGVVYGTGTTEIGRAAQQRMNCTSLSIEKELNETENQHIQKVQEAYVNFADDNMFSVLNSSDNDDSHNLHLFWEHLSVSHTVIPERKSDGSVVFSASSPDEQALVSAAAAIGGYKFEDRQPGKALVRHKQKNITREYEILQVLEFNSTRKRMSVIIKKDDTILVLSKGADTVMYERLYDTTNASVLKKREETYAQMEQFAREGLRTLVICQSEISIDAYNIWSEQYEHAVNDMAEIELRRSGSPNRIDQLMEEMEKNFTLLGVTAIEDKLQDEVPTTIFKLREANIKVWMLTGDKTETAINIAYACELVNDEIEVLVISADTHPNTKAIEMELESAPASNFSLVIDGEALEIALVECPELFRLVSCRCVSVIACRVSPAQKAQLVYLVRQNAPHIRTLAIGDGANDVSMIQAAHIGIGIAGLEGMQAANSSDYAIGQFRFLGKLLLVHGRFNYIRMAKLILYMFYKNVMMNLTQYWYMLFTGFSGQKFFLEWGLQGYNLFFTALPIILIAIWERDVSPQMALEYPRLYATGQQNSKFNTRVVWVWIVSCIWESAVICFGIVYGTRHNIFDGETTSMWVYGAICFTCVILVASLKIAYHQMYWLLRIHPLIYIGSFSLWFCTAAFISSGTHSFSLYWRGVFQNMYESTTLYLAVPLVVFLAISRDIFWKGYTRAFTPSYAHLAQEVDKTPQLRSLARYLLSYPPPTQMNMDMEDEHPVPILQQLPSQSSYLEEIPPREQQLTTTNVKEVTNKLTRQVSGAFRRAFFPSEEKKKESSNRRNRCGSAFSYDAESLMAQSFLVTKQNRSSQFSTTPHSYSHSQSNPHLAVMRENDQTTPDKQDGEQKELRVLRSHTRNSSVQMLEETGDDLSSNECDEIPHTNTLTRVFTRHASFGSMAFRELEEAGTIHESSIENIEQTSDKFRKRNSAPHLDQQHSLGLDSSPRRSVPRQSLTKLVNSMLGNEQEKHEQKFRIPTFSSIRNLTQEDNSDHYPREESDNSNEIERSDVMLRHEANETNEGGRMVRRYSTRISLI